MEGLSQPGDGQVQWTGGYFQAELKKESGTVHQFKWTCSGVSRDRLL